jgi:hypothetical protein
MLVMLGLMIKQASRPASWRWLEAAAAESAPGAPNAAPPKTLPDEAEKVVPGPTDLDESEQEEAKQFFSVLRDKHPMTPAEMPAYWKLFLWTQSQSFAELQRRAERNPFFTRFWEDSAKRRGKIVELKLDIRRVLSHDAPENPLGVTKVYELWGVTNESRGHPYVVVTSELPAEIPEGASVYAKGLFAGYFLKVLGYQAADTNRGAPLLVGRIRALPMPPSPHVDAATNRTQFWQCVLVGSVLLVAFLGFQYLKSRSRSKSRKNMPHSVPHSEAEDDTEAWLADATKRDSPSLESAGPPILPAALAEGESMPLAAKEQEKREEPTQAIVNTEAFAEQRQAEQCQTGVVVDSDESGFVDQESQEPVSKDAD